MFEMSEVSEELELGELSDESFDLKQIAWKIPNALSLSNVVNYKVLSPPFSFSDATWNLELYPFGNTEEKSEGYMDLCIIRLNSQIPAHHVFFKIYFKTRHGRNFDRYCDDALFDTNSCMSGVIGYLKKKSFNEMKKILAPDGVLTVICQMRVSKIVQINKYSQTVLAIPNSDLDDTRESNPSVPLHHNKILSDLKELYSKQDDSDVVLKVKGKDFPAHKLILKMRSPVFAATFRNHMKEKLTGVVEIEDCDPSSFSVFLKFLYCGNAENLSMQNVFGLFTSADKYDVQDLRIKCVDFMKNNLSVDTFCEVISVALQHSETELIKLCTDFFAKNLRKIILTVKWQMFLAQNPTHSNELFIKALLPDQNSK